MIESNAQMMLFDRFIFGFSCALYKIVTTMENRLGCD